MSSEIWNPTRKKVCELKRFCVECCWMLLFQICSLLLYHLFTHHPGYVNATLIYTEYLISVHFYSCHLFLGEKSSSSNEHVRSKESLPSTIRSLYVSFSLWFWWCFSHQHLGIYRGIFGGRFLLASAGAVVLTKGFSSVIMILGVGEKLKTVEDQVMHQTILPSYWYWMIYVDVGIAKESGDDVFPSLN